MRVYFDNAATTAIAPEVIEVMTSALQNLYGNPSSIHADGRNVRSAIEAARKTIARLIGAGIGEIFFTSGGTENVAGIIGMAKALEMITKLDNF